MSRGVAIALGIIQSFFIVRLLSVSDWGVIQIAASIGGAFGIYQHLGLASGSTREISAAKDDTEIFKIFLMSTLIRYAMTLPIAIWLFFAARGIATNQYNLPSLTLPLQMFALVLMLQGVQSLLNSVISGTKRFKNLFLFQAGIAVVSVIIYIPLIAAYRVNGYFYALVLFNLVSSVILGYLAFKPLKFRFELPTKVEFKMLMKDLLSISLAIYAIKIIYTMWEKSGPILLGLHITPELVGIFAFALLYAKKLMAISDAITDVNLPVLSDKFVHDFEAFKDLFRRNFDKIFAVIVYTAAIFIYWSPELVRFAVKGDKYDRALPFIFPIVFAYIFYSFTNIITASVSIPAKYSRDMIISFIVLLAATVAFYFGASSWLGGLAAMSYGMFIGAILSFLYLVVATQLKLKFIYFNHDHVLLLIQCVVISLAWNTENIAIKLGAFIIYTVLLGFAIYLTKFIEVSDFDVILRKIKR
ncbi:MAG TPA: oligosaccharide flippase family protein [Candidatus Saccharimonadales bacterium]|nr:oligosaccharide flippase family protein [Candidatus Saccharimonadales bacterium]